MAIMIISEGITPERMVILYPMMEIKPITQIMLTITTASEAIITRNDRKNKNMIATAINIEIITNRNNSCCINFVVTVLI